MNNFLTDIEIMKWNDIVTNYVIKPYFGYQSSYPDILIFREDKYNMNLTQIDDVEIRYQLTFSVSSNRTDKFFDILNKLLNIPFKSHISISYADNSEKKTPLLINEEVITDINEYEHEVLKRKFKKYTYTFSGKISNIMAYVSCITSTIEYFQLIWGYDEDGNEHCLLPHPIGTIVSKKDDKSKDYLVLDYKYNKSTNSKYSIQYVICEMLDTSKSIIQYGETSTHLESELCHSRNSRIDDILN